MNERNTTGEDDFAGENKFRTKSRRREQIPNKPRMPSLGFGRKEWEKEREKTDYEWENRLWVRERERIRNEREREGWENDAKNEWEREEWQGNPNWPFYY